MFGLNMAEVAEIFKQFGPRYRQNNKLPIQMHKVMNAIENCRTSALGGHVEKCNSCEYIRVFYNSCRNRHCPKCQGLAKEKWLLARERDLLPVSYYHIVFTIPSELNPVALRNKKEVYNLLFKASSESLVELGNNPKYLGAEIGFIAILHTWGQNLMEHPHIHIIIPAGGLSLDQQRWIHSRKNFLLPIKVISRLFRGKFMAYYKKACSNGKIKFEGQIEALSQNNNHQALIDSLYEKNWVVYTKEPFSNPMSVIQYLGRYTHRVAISNQRIIGIKDGKISFRWKDYADKNKNKVMVLAGEEFIRRFLLHVLPKQFMKIRHYGILSNRSRKNKLEKCQEILNVNQKPVAKILWQELILKLKGIDVTVCPSCKKGHMVRKELLMPRCCSPPKRHFVA